MTETRIHQRLDVLFFKAMNDVLRNIERASQGRTLRIERRMRLGKKLCVDLRIRLIPRKGGEE